MSDWPDIAAACGLSSILKRKRRFWHREAVKVEMVPTLKFVGCFDSELVFRVRSLMGQIVDDLLEAADRIRHTLDADRMKCASAGRVVVFGASFGNELSVPFGASVPELPDSTAGEPEDRGGV